MTDDGKTVRLSQAEFDDLLETIRTGEPMPWTGPREVYVVPNGTP